MVPTTLVDRVRESRERRHAPILLELDLAEPLLEALPVDPLGRLQARRRTALRTVLERLHDAAGDANVGGLVARVGAADMAVAQAQELRDAVVEFRRSGKPTVAWAESFGEFGRGSTPYLLATGFGEIWLQPSGDVSITGAALEATFLRAALDKIGVEPQFDHRGEYKNASDQLTQPGFTDAHREASDRLTRSLHEQLVTTIAAGRRLPPDRVRELVDRAPLLAGEALEAGLVDHLGYRDEVYASMRRRIGAEPRLTFLARYQRHGRAAQARRKVATRRRPVVALVHVTGVIRQGRSGRNPVFGPAAGSDSVGAAIRSAVRDDTVRAIVFRIDSRGGSYVASDTIRREVELAKEAGKPVVVSMGGVAASGGYFIACPADVIVAEPGTLTGSIGVYHGKPVVAGLLDRLGIGHDATTAGRQARITSVRTPFTDEEWRRLQLFLDRVYDDFVGRVAQGRRMPRERVHEVARGRVWTGADARERGLVDQLGGVSLAGRIARERAGLPEDAEVRSYPHVSPVQRLRTPRSSDDPAVAGMRVEAWGPLADLATRAGLPVGGPLLVPWPPRVDMGG